MSIMNEILFTLFQVPVKKIVQIKLSLKVFGTYSGVLCCVVNLGINLRQDSFNSWWLCTTVITLIDGSSIDPQIESAHIEYRDQVFNIDNTPHQSSALFEFMKLLPPKNCIQ